MQDNSKYIEHVVRKYISQNMEGYSLKLDALNDRHNQLNKKLEKHYLIVLDNVTNLNIMQDKLKPIDEFHKKQNSFLEELASIDMKFQSKVKKN